ncbi:MAG TPA: cyclopropane-fatty-acyl-phospholipid synthase family protein [Burkholderiaceae bacterium]
MARSSSPALTSSEFDDVPTEAATRILQRLLGPFDGGVALRLWNGETHQFGVGAPHFTLVFNDPSVLRDLVLRRSPLPLAEAYFHGRLDVEGDLYAALRLKAYFQDLSFSGRERAGLLVDALRLAFLPSRKRNSVGEVRETTQFRHDHSPDSDQAAVAHHYDVSNAFYKLFLDERMVYSCAYFHEDDDTLDMAQAQKLDHICRKLRLKPGERYLDIGCGWGALVIWAARHYGVTAHGITLSKEQLAEARERIRAEGLQDRVTVELRDYRALEGEGVYDKVSSVGMLEHVGLANLPAYHATVHRVLKPNGLFLNHGITHEEDGWHKTIDTEFINRYVFPDGELDRVSAIQAGMERAKFEIQDVENLRQHYARTLRHWVHKLEGHRDEALRHVSEATYRVWRLYMAACALEFESGGTQIYQILASRRPEKQPYAQPVPLTRRDLYAGLKAC